MREASETTRRRIEKAMDRIEYLQMSKVPSTAAEQAPQSETARANEASSLDWEAEDEAPASTSSSQRRRDRS